MSHCLQPLLCLEGRLPGVLLPDPYLMVSRLQIQLAEVARLLQLIQQVIYPA